MKNIRKLIFIIAAAFYMSSFLQAQAVIQSNDTLRMEQALQQTQERQKGDENAIDNPSNDDSKKTAADKNKGTKVKQVKGARPDMSKAKGARPQSIERPAGSRIPKGIGKPGGAGKPGGR